MPFFCYVDRYWPVKEPPASGGMEETVTAKKQPPASGEGASCLRATSSALAKKQPLVDVAVVASYK